MKDKKSQSISTVRETSPVVQELRAEFFQGLLGRLEDPVFVKNSAHQWIFANEAFEKLVGNSDLVGKTDADLLPEDQVEKFYEGDDYVIRTQNSLTQEEQIGDGVFALVKKIPITLPDNTPGLFGIIFDISEYRKVQLEVEKLRLAKVQSRTDPLTGLANRRHLDNYYKELIRRNESTPSAIGLLHIDLDLFKEINDTKGHLSGDAVLIHIANVLRDCTRKTDFVARIGGDEFVAIIDDQSPLEPENIAQRIIASLEKPVTIEGELVEVSVSVGVAYDNSGVLPLSQMLKFADLALYRAKHNGRGRFEHFTSSIQKEHDEHRQRREEFRTAIEEGQFFPFYQPQFDTETLEMIGVEALARWNHPERGVLPPSEFLETAMTERRLIDVDRAIFRAAMNDATAMHAMGMTMPVLSINVSPQSLAARDFIEVIKYLEPFPSRVCFELVETMLLDKPSGVVSSNLDGLRDLGVSLDIDDFGSGHTSLLGMLEVRPDRVKIDQRLIIPMLESKKHLDLVKSIIQIADSLGMDTIAEGVESDDHRQQLKLIGCQSIQGFGFARPMPLNELVEMLGRKAA